MGCPGAGELVVWLHTVPLAMHVSAQIKPWFMRPAGPGQGCKAQFLRPFQLEVWTRKWLLEITVGYVLRTHLRSSGKEWRHLWILTVQPAPFPFRCINYFKRWLFCQELSDCKIVRRLLEFVVASRSILGNGVVQEEDPQVTCCRTVTSLPQDSTDWQISSQSRHSKVTWHLMRGSDKQGCGEIKPKEYLAQLDLFTF